VKFALFETHVTWCCYQSGCNQFNDHILGNFMIWSLSVKHVVGSGVTRGLSQGRQRLAKGRTLVTIEGPVLPILWKRYAMIVNLWMPWMSILAEKTKTPWKT